MVKLDKERPVCFTMYTYVLFKRQTGVDYFSLSEGDELSYEHTMNLYFCAMVVGAIVMGEEFDIEFEPDFMILCDGQVMMDLAGIKANTDPPKEEVTEKHEEKNGQSHSRSKRSKKLAPAK